jgi:hypothetical protein
VSDSVVVTARAADIPVDAPWALSLTMLLLLAAGTWALRRR